MSAFREPLRRLTAETVWLQTEFLREATSPRGERAEQLACEMAVIRLHDAWARFCRELVILSAYGHTSTLGGLQLTPSDAAIKSRSSVVPFLLKKYKRRKYEPKWARADECIEAASRLSIVNLPIVSAALGATNNPADAIRHVRNFYVHRGKDAALLAKSTNCFLDPRCPHVFDLAEYTSGGNRVIESWTAALIVVATAAAQ
jgi:hypothetical protein